MKAFFALSAIFILHNVTAFTAFTRKCVSVKKLSSTSQAVLPDSSIFHEFSPHFNTIHDAFSSLSIADVEATAGVTPLTDTLQDVSATQAAASGSGNGPMGFLAGPFEIFLKIIHGLFVNVGLNEGAWGLSIVSITVIIKLLTYPISKQQLESNLKMQALSPAMKEIQTKYASNQQVMNQKMAEFYQVNDVNPLAGCIPSLVQIPIFVGLYRAVLTLAKDDKINERFLWLPNLEGPTYGADPAHSGDWIFKGWTDGVPSLGWEDTIAFLSIPLILVISQFLSMQIMQPKSDDPSQQQSNAVLKVLPLMIGYFSLNVPAALGIYWVANNFISTAITMQIRNAIKTSSVTPVAPGTSASMVVDVQPEAFTPSTLREKPAGFGVTDYQENPNEVTPITTPSDAVIVAEETGSPQSSIDNGMESQKRGGKKKKKKKRN